METIRTLVQTLVVIALLAVLLEMLLPDGSMSRYVRLITGLLVVIAVLHAFGDMIHREVAVELPVVTGEKAGDRKDLDEILAQGQVLFERNRSLALENYRKGLASQIRSLVGLNGRVEVLDVDVRVNDVPESASYGQVEQVRLVLSNRVPAEREVEKNGEGRTGVTPVQIQVGGSNADESGDGSRTGSEGERGELDRSEVAAEVTRVVANFYGLSPEQVRVDFK